MKLLLPLLLFITTLAYSQTSDHIPKYPAKYTIETADSLILLKDNEKAVWYLINIYGTDPKVAEERIRTLKKEIPDMDMFIKKTFAIYSVFDPEIGDMSSGTMVIDMANMKRKGAWGDALVIVAKE